MMKLINKYFKELTDIQRQQFELLGPLYKEWNKKINVISRKDIDNIYEHHVLHSLAIAKEFHFKDGTNILDFGCGGGFPGIPLAILFPHCQFKLIDGTGKKVMVAREIAKAIGLHNAAPVHLRGEEEKGLYDFVVSRAVMPLPDMFKIVKKNISKTMSNAHPNGVICLKGGQLAQELKPMGKQVEVIPVSNYFEEEWFKEKYIVYSY
ncbi:16S rRNA (guanine(527)-N(7))-methyltransferase RsmG [Prevotella sp. A2931]|uniref:Ribosomal RNA small subunit methyltransferase G n=2 Tax=Prevotellaceae TaxID=171552 RepID=A0ABS3M7L2_9BACT|nr:MULTISPECIES: 16S rRNA (guanine(527)-N(7))-methyltransferase RsmG [Prevotella]MBO1364051.1 16S rRNA (guanine(527)-N(7))-methyltransferase RsmG [Prevotella illustrans]